MRALNLGARFPLPLIFVLALAGCTGDGAWDLFADLEGASYQTGTPSGPTVVSLIADDADDGDAVFGNGDTITVCFSEATNQVPVATRAALDAIFAPSQSLGSDYTGSWSAPDTLVITIVDATGAAPPTIGGLTLTLLAGNNIKNAAGTSSECAGVSPSIAGDWGGSAVTLIAAEDTDINGASPTTNYGASTDLILNQSGGDLGERRLLIRFDLSPIPPGATVTSAVLKLNKEWGVVAAVDVDLHRVAAPWSEVEATWNDRVSGTPWGTAGGDYDATLIARTTVSANGEYQWSSASLTSLVDGWHKCTVNNHGLLIGSRDFGGSDRFFASRSHATVTNRPKLEVTYVTP
jgi:hypothetical protein